MNAMAEYATPATCGVDHVGLSVQDLESTRRFFLRLPGVARCWRAPDIPRHSSRTANRLSPWAGRGADKRSRSIDAPTSAFII